MAVIHKLSFLTTCQLTQVQGLMILTGSTDLVGLREVNVGKAPQISLADLPNPLTTYETYENQFNV